MRPIHEASQIRSDRVPALQAEAAVLASYLQTIMPKDYEIVMKFSHEMAQKTHRLMHDWSMGTEAIPAIEIFLGDKYSGLQASSFSDEDREYAHQHLWILSGLYGVVRALDGIRPYRLEMGYKLPGNAHDASQPNITNLYEYWGDKITKVLPPSDFIINVSAVEYTKAVFTPMKKQASFNAATIITPKFLTVSLKTGLPTFVTVHAKIARGTFARWVIRNRIEDVSKLKEFNEIGYVYAPELSTETEPVFLAQQFKGLGLSVRQRK
jgi:cytoplasmic iron level regulating protein YaaA (DUF328/UPF0246 family)